MTAFRCTPMRVWVSALCAAGLLLAGCRREAAPPAGPEDVPVAGPELAAAPSTFPVEQLGKFYQAAGYCEMDQYQRAAELYGELVSAGLTDPAVLANLAVALLGMQQTEQARVHAAQAAAAAPGHEGILLVHVATLQAAGAAAEALETLGELSRRNASGVRGYYAWLTALQNADPQANREQIAAAYDALVRLAPRNVAALLGAARVHAERGKVDVAGDYLSRALAIVPDPPAALGPIIDRLPQVRTDAAQLARSITMTRNVLVGTDRYRADVLDLGPPPGGLPALIPRPLAPPSASPSSAIQATLAFEDATTAAALEGAAASGGGLVCGRLGEERAMAVYFLHPGAAGRLLVWRGERFEDVTAAAGLAEASPARSGLFTDTDNDRRMDLLLCAEAGPVLFRQVDEGRFEDATAAAGLAGLEPCKGAAPFDFDHDGDLDLITWGDAVLRLLRSDGTGRFEDAGPRPGLPGDIANIRAVQTIDLDDDGDLDIAVTTAANGAADVRVFSNERLACFREIPLDLGAPLAGPPVIADLDADGRYEMFDLGVGLRHEIASDFAVRIDDKPRRSIPGGSTAVADFDCDGRLDLLACDAAGNCDLPGLKVPPGSVLHAADVDGDGRVDLLTSSGRLLRNVSTGAGHWLSVALVGLNVGDSRFNAFGIGSTIEVRAGDLYCKRPVLGPLTHFGLGPYPSADVVRITWPNGNYQNLQFRVSDAMALAGDRVVVTEQSLKGSCPYLYAWDGKRFAFVTDVLWRSALGMSIMQGVYGHHGTADDYFKIDGAQLAPRDGWYVLQFTEELWETAYLDRCRLLAVDHPPGTDVFVDEKCLNPPYPPMVIHGVRHPRAPRRAVDHNGRDVADLLARRDGRTVAGFRPTRYQGLVEDHDLILDLGPVQPGAEVKLFLHGWLWPTDASINVAVAQNPEIDPRPPVLFVADGAPAGQQRVQLGKQIHPTPSAAAHAAPIAAPTGTRHDGGGLAVSHDMSGGSDTAISDPASDPRGNGNGGGSAGSQAASAASDAATADSPAPPPGGGSTDDADWRPVDIVVGFPSGKNKTLVLDLTGRLPGPEPRVKISTNFAIYWDHVFFTAGPQNVDTKVTELPMVSADLHHRGFSYAYPRVPGGPEIPDYQALDPRPRWRGLVGWYTRYGEVTELLGAADSMYAIVAAGEEITLAFSATAAPPLPPGWRRDFVIHTDGWLKDGDLNSAKGGTVEPLPFHGMSAYPYPANESYPDTPQHRAYRETYNTRWRGHSESNRPRPTLD